MKILFCSLLIAASAFGQQDSGRISTILNELSVEVTDTTQGLVLTNNVSEMFLSEPKSAHRFPWEGFIVDGKELMKDYAVKIDGYPVRKEDVIKVFMSPYRMTRVYRTGLEETAYLLDSADAMVVELKNLHGKSFTVHPMYSDATNDSDYSPIFELNVLIVTNAAHPVRTKKQDYPASIAYSLVNELYSSAGFYESQQIGPYFSPAYLSTVKQDTLHRFLIVPGDSLKDAYIRLKKIAKKFDEIVTKTNSHRAEFMSSVQPTTGDSKTRIAYSWAAAGMEGLLSSKGNLQFLAKTGPGQTPAIPGSALFLQNGTGGPDELQSLISLQDTNAGHETYGQISGKASSAKASFDVAPWVTLLIDRWASTRAGMTVPPELYQAVRRTIDGTLKKRPALDALVPSLYGRAQTSFNDNMQRVWMAELDAGIRLATRAGDAASSDKWTKVRKSLSKGSRK